MSEYNPKMASALFSATANPKDIWGVDVSRENAILQNAWDNERLDKQEKYRREDSETDWNRKLAAMSLGSDLDIYGDSTKYLNRKEIDKQFGIGDFAPNSSSQKVHQYIRE